MDNISYIDFLIHSYRLDVNQYGGLGGTFTTHALVDLFQKWHNISYTLMELSAICMLILEMRLTPLIIQYC